MPAKQRIDFACFISQVSHPFIYVQYGTQWKFGGSRSTAHCDLRHPAENDDQEILLTVSKHKTASKGLYLLKTLQRTLQIASIPFTTKIIQNSKFRPS